MAELPSPNQENDVVLMNFIASNNIERSVWFYTRVLRGELAMDMDGGPAVVKLANGLIIINGGGGPTDDNPEVTLEVPTDPTRTSAFLNLRVADVHAVYAKWSALGAEFLTDPKDHGHEIRCYMRDPDGPRRPPHRGGPEHSRVGVVSPVRSVDKRSVTDRPAPRTAV